MLKRKEGERAPFSENGKPNPLPKFPYGAVYFRKSNPPQEDWQRDYGTAQADHNTAFRHWFLWSGTEVAPGKYKWDDYDKQFDLAAEHGIKTIIAEMITMAPEWAFRKYSHALLESRDGTKQFSRMQVSCASGGAPGLCLDHDDVREAAGRWLTELVNRYKDHPGMGGYDILNECNMSHCYCDATAAKFRLWLKEKYGDLETLGNIWHRYSYSEWDDVMPPRHSGVYADVMDWCEFNNDRLQEQMRWRYNLIRSLDPNHPITAHGIASTFRLMAQRSADDWRAAAEVESYGYTWGSSRHGDEPWKQSYAVDLVRASSRGKPFWHAEAYGGPLWLQSNVLNKPRDEGRIAAPDDIRYWNLVSYMNGATGTLFLRWRPLLDGPLFGAFGPYGMDGSRTDRSDASTKIAKWVADPAQDNLWQSRPVKGEIGIIYVPESQIFNYALEDNVAFYRDSMEGAYQGFFDNNIQADWVHIDHIDEYDALYLPFPVMLKEETAKRLREWIKAGGTLISEGCPAYFGDNAHVGQVQPNYGLNEVFGTKETYIEFTPDLLEDLKLNVDGDTVRGGIFLQAYEPTTGTASGWYDDGSVAAVDNTFGKGRTRLIGTMCGAGYGAHPDDRSSAFFQRVLEFAGKTQHASVNDPRVKARIHEGDGGRYLWVANPKRHDIRVRVKLSDGTVSSCKTLRGGEASSDGCEIRLNAPARDVTVLKLD